MEYVVGLLRDVFKKSESEALKYNLMVHKKGSEFVEFLLKRLRNESFTVIKKAKSDQHPLKCVMEPE